MDNETLDRMVAAWFVRENISPDLSCQADFRQRMLAALRAMWRPIEEAPKDFRPSIVTDCKIDYDMIGYKTKGEWFDFYDDASIEPTHFSSQLPGPEE